MGPEINPELRKKADLVHQIIPGIEQITEQIVRYGLATEFSGPRIGIRCFYFYPLLEAFLRERRRNLDDIKREQIARFFINYVYEFIELMDSWIISRKSHEVNLVIDCITVEEENLWTLLFLA